MQKQTLQAFKLEQKHTESIPTTVEECYFSELHFGLSAETTFFQAAFFQLLNMEKALRGSRGGDYILEIHRLNVISSWQN